LAISVLQPLVCLARALTVISASAAQLQRQHVVYSQMMLAKPKLPSLWNLHQVAQLKFDASTL